MKIDHSCGNEDCIIMCEKCDERNCRLCEDLMIDDLLEREEKEHTEYLAALDEGRRERFMKAIQEYQPYIG